LTPPCAALRVEESDARCEMRRNSDDGEHMSETYDANDEQADSSGAIEELAQATNRPFAEVKEVYEAELARLKVDARIGDYLHLFASRRTLERLSDPAS